MEQTYETNKKCPDCGVTLEMRYEVPWQEYPGASVQGGTTSYECEKCGYYKQEQEDVSKCGQENHRGW